MDGSMSGSVNGMIRAEDGQNFFTGGDYKVSKKLRAWYPVKRILETIKCCGIFTFLF